VSSVCSALALMTEYDTGGTNEKEAGNVRLIVSRMVVGVYARWARCVRALKGG
jgi:hypothetical protein